MEKVARVTEGGDSVDITVEFIFDPDSDNWAFRVPNLNITGGAKTEAEVRELAREAILYALEGEDIGSAATQRGYFRATVSAPDHLLPAAND
jgi:hypothetical protein